MKTIRTKMVTARVLDDGHVSFSSAELRRLADLADAATGSCTCSAVHAAELGSQHDPDCPRYRLIDLSS